MKKSLVLLSLSAIVTLNSSADTFGFEAGAAFGVQKHQVILSIEVLEII